ncbi:MAG TPA: hypothetical protein VF590_06490, partial [Isosphaeraceae bacterium]
MRQRHRFVPAAVDRLEGRLALSHGMAGPAAAQVALPAAGTRQSRTQVLDLRGTIFGTETPSAAAPGGTGAAVRAAKAYVYPLRKVRT